ncbi:MAG: BtpA/SgcQ family protein [Saprospiraceae bacterium]|nr:BtpA/SgcQ family protein [Saprospiraceae bacterium]
MTDFKTIFKKNTPIIGMIHLKALPGTPQYKHDVNFILDTALKEVQIYMKAGVDALLIENMNDVPYTKKNVGHEITAVMAMVANEVKKLSQLPCGIQILAAANEAAMAVALATGLDFIRAEGFVFGHLADEGYIDSNAAELLRYRKMLGSENIAVFTDIKKKHSSHAISVDVDVVETALAAQYFLSDGLVITGTSTAQESDINELEAIRYACNIPVLVGSGVTIDNVAKFMAVSDGIIVGSHFKKGGHWANDLDYDKVAEFMAVVNKIRN